MAKIITVDFRQGPRDTSQQEIFKNTADALPPAFVNLEELSLLLGARSANTLISHIKYLLSKNLIDKETLQNFDNCRPTLRDLQAESLADLGQKLSDFNHLWGSSKTSKVYRNLIQELETMTNELLGKNKSSLVIQQTVAAASDQEELLVDTAFSICLTQLREAVAIAVINPQSPDENLIALISILDTAETFRAAKDLDKVISKEICISPALMNLIIQTSENSR